MFFITADTSIAVPVCVFLILLEFLFITMTSEQLQVTWMYHRFKAELDLLGFPHTRKSGN